MDRGDIFPLVSAALLLVAMTAWLSMRPTEARRQGEMEELALGIDWPKEYRIGEPQTELPHSNWKSSTSGTTWVSVFAAPDEDPNLTLRNIAELLEAEGFAVHDDPKYFRCHEDQITFVLSRRTEPPFIVDVRFMPAHTTSSGGEPGTEVERPPTSTVRFFWSMENEPGDYVFSTGQGEIRHCPDIVGA